MPIMSRLALATKRNFKEPASMLNAIVKRIDLLSMLLSDMQQVEKKRIPVL